MGELVYGPKAGVGTWLAVGVTAAALCVPAIAVVAAPRLSEPSTLPAAASAETTLGPVGRIDAQLSQLPIVITDFPDSSSQKAAAEYTSLHLQQPGAAASMFSDTWVSLTATQETVDAATYLGRYLVSAPSDYLADIHGEVHGAAAAALPGADSRSTECLQAQ